MREQAIEIGEEKKTTTLHRIINGGAKVERVALHFRLLSAATIMNTSSRLVMSE